MWVRLAQRLGRSENPVEMAAYCFGKTDIKSGLPKLFSVCETHKSKVQGIFHFTNGRAKTQPGNRAPKVRGCVLSELEAKPRTPDFSCWTLRFQ